MGSTASTHLDKCYSKRSQAEVCNSVQDLVTTVVQNKHDQVSANEYLRREIEKHKGKASKGEPSLKKSS